MKSFQRMILTAAIATAAMGPLTASGQSYGIRDLGTLGGPTAGGMSISEFGLAAGFSTKGDASMHAFTWRRSGLVDLGPLSGDLQSHAFSVNRLDDVVGMSFDLGELNIHGVIWQNNVPTSLGNLAPLDVNTGRVVAGYVSFDSATFGGWVDHAATWNNGATTDLGTLGGDWSYAHAINDGGTVVGMAFTAGNAARRATLWLSGVPHDLGTLGGTNSHARDISEFGEVVGYADTAAGAPHGFLYTTNASGGVTSRVDLGELGGGYSYAYGVNNVAQVIGTSDARAFLWQNGAMQDLNALLPPGGPIWRLDMASAINDRGQIVGSGLYYGQPRAFVMSPFEAGDANCDGTVNTFDIQPFITALASQPQYWAAYPHCNVNTADANQDGTVNPFDIQPFIQMLGG